MKAFAKFLELCIAVACAVMVAVTWNQTELVTAWTIATVGWLSISFSGNA